MKYLIEKVKVGDPKEWEKNGRKGNYWNVGVKIAGIWYNQNYFDEKIVNRFKEVEGREIPLILFDQEYNGEIYKKFRIPKKEDLLEDRINDFEKRLSDLEKKVNDFIVPTKEIVPPEDDEENDNGLPF